MSEQYDRLDTITFSSAEAYIRCPYAFKKLYLEGLPNTSGGAARRGTAAHAAVAEYLRDGVWTAETWDDAVEVAINASPAEDIDDLRVIFKAFEREYGDPPRIVPDGATDIYVEQSFVFDANGNLTDDKNGAFGGTIDLMYRVGDILTVLDWKTGGTIHNNAVWDDRQMRGYALIARRLFPDVKYIELIRHYIRFEHSAQGRGEPVPAAEFDSVWAEIVARTAPIFAAIEADNFPATPHEFCGWCPALAFCPAQAKWVGQIKGDGLPGPVEEIAELREAARLTEKLATAALKRHVEANGAVNGAGRHYDFFSQTRRTLDREAVYRIIIAKGGTLGDSLEAASGVAAFDKAAAKFSLTAEEVDGIVVKRSITQFKGV